MFMVRFLWQNWFQIKMLRQVWPFLYENRFLFSLKRRNKWIKTSFRMYTFREFYFHVCCHFPDFRRNARDSSSFVAEVRELACIYSTQFFIIIIICMIYKQWWRRPQGILDSIFGTAATYISHIIPIYTTSNGIHRW